MSSFHFTMSDSTAPSLAKNSSCRSPRQSLQEYGRGIAGGLLFSLPLLYTMEMWELGFTLQPSQLLAALIATFGLLLLYNRFAGMRADSRWSEVAIDSVEELGIGLLLAVFVLWMTGQLGADSTLNEKVGKVLVEALAVAIGVSVGTAQLGSNPESEDEDASDDQQTQDLRQSFVAQCSIALCGAVIIASNVAPTAEIQAIAFAATPAKILTILALSLVLGALILFGLEFRGTTSSSNQTSTRCTTIALDIVAGTVIAYAISLLISAAMLWFFGRFSDVALIVALYQSVVLALPAMLGASAGRLLLQSES